MHPEIIEMGKTRPDWAKNSRNIMKDLEEQSCNLQNLYHKVLVMRYETALVGLQYLKTKKILQDNHELASLSDSDEGENSNNLS